jgi:hypothetical protein
VEAATASAVETAAASAVETAAAEARESWCCSEDQGQQDRAELTDSPHNAPRRRAPACLAVVLRQPQFLIVAPPQF